uniref:Transmembrane protein 110, like n=1 Tax=Salmo trutta TaxID=8032 RepID=A0A674F6M0_SALTR
MDIYGYNGVFLVKRLFNNAVLEISNMSDITKENPQGCDNGALTNRFGVLIQGLLAIVAFITMVMAILHFTPSHLYRFYDMSKQAIDAPFIHFANVFLSNLTEMDPCSLYLINFLLDATLGVLVIWAGVKVVSRIVEYKQFTLLTFGEYGDPPQAAAWLGQCGVYLLIMVLEKSVVSLVLLIPGWTNSVLLDYIPNPQVDLVLVMLIVPVIVNVSLNQPAITLHNVVYMSEEAAEGRMAHNNGWNGVNGNHVFSDTVLFIPFQPLL